MVRMGTPNRNIKSRLPRKLEKKELPGIIFHAEKNIPVISRNNPINIKPIGV